MNMIPLVRATEPGKAHVVNLSLLRIVVLRSISSAYASASLFGRKRRRG